MGNDREGASLIERAHHLLRQAEAWGELDDEQRLYMAAAGASVYKAQTATLNYAATLALVSVAESLASLAAVFERSQLGATIADDDEDQGDDVA